MTVKKLRELLFGLPEDFPIELMIENYDGSQWQFPMTDLAVSTSKIIMISEPGE